MPGSSEFLIIIVIVAVIFFVVPMLRKVPVKKQAADKAVSGSSRLAIIATIIWPALIATITEPWKGEVLKFIYFGFAPVGLAWALGWVMAGYKKGA